MKRVRTAPSSVIIAVRGICSQEASAMPGVKQALRSSKDYGIPVFRKADTSEAQNRERKGTTTEPRGSRNAVA